MEIETSSQDNRFESSEMLATFLASTPLLEESWKLCRQANTASPGGFVTDHCGSVAYVAFSGVQMVAGLDPSCQNLIELGPSVEGLFPAFCRRGETDEPVKVHAGLLQLFLSFYGDENFQHKMQEIVNGSCQSIIFTGHSLGGSLASLSALWLLSNFQNTSPSRPVFALTFGSPMLGNEPFSLAILQERWTGNFCHIIAQHDLLPRLLFTQPNTPFIPQILSLFRFWNASMACSQPTINLSNADVFVLFHAVLASLREAHDRRTSTFWPFGSYMFCTENGAVCLDNGIAIVNMLYLVLAKGSPDKCITDHLMYEHYVAKVSWEYLKRGDDIEDCVALSSNEAGIAMALRSQGMSIQEPAYNSTRDTLAAANQAGCKRTLNNAKLAIELAKINPLRAQIEWYKALCDESSDQLGYYDSFKQRGTSKKGHKVNLNRVKLGHFWKTVIEKMESNQLPPDFHKQAKYVNASQSYKLLVEPLEIAEYYRTGMAKKKGHYIKHGREKRFEIFDRWWKNRVVGDEENKARSEYASLTQDTCFWARVEEARDYVFQVQREMDKGRCLALLDEIEKFVSYASGLVERKEVSKDVLAKNSSYSLFIEEWRELKSRVQVVPVQIPRFQDEMVP